MCGKITLVLLACVVAASATSVSNPGWGCESGVYSNPYRAKVSTAIKVITDEHKVTFKNKYAVPPAITLGFVHIDNYYGKNLRVRAGVKSSSASEMVLTIGKWYNSWLYMASVSYMACGPVA